MSLLRTPAGGAFPPSRDRHIYILWIALVWIGMIAGFLPDLGRYMAEKPAPPLMLHFHGAAYFVWLVLVTTQIALIELKNPKLHRRLGWWVVGVSVALVPLGLVTSMVDMTRASLQTQVPYTPEFLGLEFQSMLVFSILLTLAVRMRNDLAAHKRLMMLLIINFLDPGTSRAYSMFSPVHPDGAFGWWLSYFWGNAAMVLALMAWDLFHHRRIHPALLFGGALLATGEAVAVASFFSPWWHNVANDLVKAWGWAG